MIDLPRLFYRLLYRIFRDLIEFHTADSVVIDAEKMRNMPRNRFSFAIRVGSEIYFRSGLRFFFQHFNHIALAADRNILRLEIMFDIDAQFALRKIPHMSHRCDDFVPASEYFTDRLCLGRRFYYN